MTRPRTAMRAAGLVALAATLLAAPGCVFKPHPKPAQVALDLRDVFPYPAVTGGQGSDGDPELAPLLPGYLIYIGRKDFPGAAASFAEVAKAHPKLVEARLLQGISLVLAGSNAEAIPVLKGVVAERPDYGPGHWFLGQALFSTGDEAAALAEMREVVRIGSLYAPEATKVLAAASG